VPGTTLAERGTHFAGFPASMVLPLNRCPHRIGCTHIRRRIQSETVMRSGIFGFNIREASTIELQRINKEMRRDDRT
jgi:hypothetical protein